MLWETSWRADPEARELADRHYNRQTVGAKNFAPPGRCLVLKRIEPHGKAYWITSWPYAEYVRHKWAGAWVCSAFRNEGAGLATDLILDALRATQAYYGQPPEKGLITFLDQSKVQPIKVRGRKTWGRTWEMCGFKHVGFTGSGLMAWQLLPEDFPAPFPALNFAGPHVDFAHRGLSPALIAWALA